MEAAEQNGPSTPTTPDWLTKRCAMLTAAVGSRLLVLCFQLELVTVNAASGVDLLNLQSHRLEGGFADEGDLPAERHDDTNRVIAGPGGVSGKKRCSGRQHDGRTDLRAA